MNLAQSYFLGRIAQKLHWRLGVFSSCGLCQGVAASSQTVPFPI